MQHFWHPVSNKKMILENRKFKYSLFYSLYYPLKKKKKLSMENFLCKYITGDIGQFLIF